MRLLSPEFHSSISLALALLIPPTYDQYPLENAYSDYDVMSILNDIFFLTQQPVIMLEQDLA
ncbi:MAG: hypothetical protein ACP5IF_03195 [Conexivisphaera sp.]